MFLTFLYYFCRQVSTSVNVNDGRWHPSSELWKAFVCVRFVFVKTFIVEFNCHTYVPIHLKDWWMILKYSDKAPRLSSLINTLNCSKLFKISPNLFWKYLTSSYKEQLVCLYTMPYKDIYLLLFKIMKLYLYYDSC